MRAELHGFWSSDLPEDPDDPHQVLPLEKWTPENPESFYVNVTAVIGIAGDLASGTDFDVSVCSPQWLVDHPAEKGFRWAHGYLLLDRWSASVLERALADLCLHSEGPDRESVFDAIGDRLRSVQWRE